MPANKKFEPLNPAVQFFKIYSTEMKQPFRSRKIHKMHSEYTEKS